MILILGAGRQGECLGYALKKLGHRIFFADLQISDRVRDMYEGQWISAVDFQDIASIEKVLSLKDVDLVFSCLPYYLNLRVAEACINKKIAYCDLGGHVETSEAINKYSVENDGEVFTDLGLAPGWVNILAEECYRQLSRIDKVNTVNLCCGGLPIHQVNKPYNYISTWSTAGLINEYKDDCKVLIGGNVAIVKGMSGVEDAFAGKYECFHTSGGIGKTLHLMKTRGVRKCCYKTVRYHGHADAVRPLLDIMSNNQFDELFKNDRILKDKVVLGAEAIGNNGVYTITHEIISDHNFSAMQLCTNYPAAVVASQFMERSLYINSRDYSHVNYPAFKTELSKLLGMEL